MNKKEEQDFLKLMGSRGTIDILRYLSEHDGGYYEDFNLPFSYPTLHTRVRKLLKFDLIQRRVEKKGFKNEWYTITERGKKILEHLHDMILIHGDVKEPRRKQ